MTQRIRTAVVLWLILGMAPSATAFSSKVIEGEFSLRFAPGAVALSAMAREKFVTEISKLIVAEACTKSFAVWGYGDAGTRDGEKLDLAYERAKYVSELANRVGLGASASRTSPIPLMTKIISERSRSCTLVVFHLGVRSPPDNVIGLLINADDLWCPSPSRRPFACPIVKKPLLRNPRVCDLIVSAFANKVTKRGDREMRPGFGVKSAWERSVGQ
jgi:hypothetical protein